MTYSIRLPREFIIVFLASVYILGFLLTPYWILHRSTAEIIFHLVLTISVGLIWLYLATNSLQFEFSSKDIKLFLFLLAGVALLNYRALNSVIPFRGDETHHIELTLDVMRRILPLEGLGIIVLLTIFVISGIKKQRWMIFIGILIVVCVVFYFLGKNSFEDVTESPSYFLRYPFINYWFFAVMPKLASPIISPYHEVLYRIIPFLSMVGTAWVVQNKSGATRLLSKVIWGIAVATIPLVFYYSSILYLEPPAVFLMTVVCLDIYNLLHKSSEDISPTPSWYALILIGFVKETTIPFLLCFIVIRMVVQLQIWSKLTPKEKSERPVHNLLGRELGIIFVLLAPLFLYVYFRVTLTTTRSFTPRILNLFDLTNYRFVMFSFLEQFGLFLFFFVAGCILLIRNKEFRTAFCYIALILAVLAFHMMDYEVYAGYSRFNLFVLPAMLAGSAMLITWATKQNQFIGNLLALVAIVINLLLSPVNLDGVKVPYWGSYRIDDSEHYYPYQDALIWLKNDHGKKRMLFTGLDFYYPFQFYWNKLDWKPRKDGIPSEAIEDETVGITSLLEKAKRERYTVVIYRVKDENLVLPQETGEFHVQVIRNSAHSLIIFYKP